MENPAGEVLRGVFCFLRFEVVWNFWIPLCLKIPYHFVFYGLLRTVHRRGSGKSSLISCCFQTSRVMIGIESCLESCDEVGAQVRLF